MKLKTNTKKNLIRIRNTDAVTGGRASEQDGGAGPGEVPRTLSREGDGKMKVKQQCSRNVQET
jgi:hypothetical protein